MCVGRAYQFFASQKYQSGFNANSLAQTFALIYEHSSIDGANSHSGNRMFFSNWANKRTAIHILKTLADHRNLPVQQPKPDDGSGKSDVTGCEDHLSAEISTCRGRLIPGLVARRQAENGLMGKQQI